MGEIVEVSARIQSKVRLQQDQPAVRPEQAGSLTEQRPRVVTVEMLEQIGRKHHIERVVVKIPQVPSIADDAAHVRLGTALDDGIDIDRHDRTSRHLVGEVAPACAEFENV